MQIKHIPLSKIKSSGNVRTEIDDELGGLIESIENYGLLQPVLVIKRSDHYELVAGHRRYAAMKARNEPTIECFVREDIRDRDLSFIKLTENIQRKQMTPREVVECLDAMMAENPMLSKPKLAALLGKSNAWVYMKYKAAKIIEDLLDDGLEEEIVQELTEGDLLKLAHVKNTAERKRIASRLPGAKNKKEEIKTASSFEIEKRAPQRDITGGFYVYPSTRNKIGIVCKSAGLRDKLITELLKIKIAWESGEEGVG